MADSSTSSASPPPPDGNAVSSSETNLKVLKCSHTWTINNFSYCWMKLGEELKSPTFSSENDKKIAWCVSLYPGGKNDENRDNVSIYLTLVSSYKAEIRAKYKFCILDDKGEEKNCYENVEVQTFSQKCNDHKPGYGHPEFVARSFLMDKANGLLPNDNLTIVCEIRASTIIPNRSMLNRNVQQADQWGCTQVKLVKFSYMWTISNFSFYNKETGQAIESPIFSAAANSKSKWKLNLYPNGQGEKYNEYVSLFLMPATSNESDINVTLNFCIISSKGEKSNAFRSASIIFVKGTSGHGYPKFVKRDYLLNKANELLPDDRLSILCEISYVADILSVSGENKPIMLKVPERGLSGELEILLRDKTFSDVTLVVHDREIPAHKAILAARSPVFSAMFQRDMEEQRLNRVEITDIDYEVFREMLCFIYTDKVRNLSDTATALLRAADKYDLEKLKVMCEQSLCTRLGIENAADMLILADMHKAEQLKSQAVDFINTHITEMMGSARFESMLVSHSELVAEIAIQRWMALNKNEI